MRDTPACRHGCWKRRSYEYLLFIAGDLPDDLREDGAYTPEDVEAAFQAFRKTLKERSDAERP